MNETSSIEERYLDRPYIVSGRLIDPIGGSATYADQRNLLNRKQLEVLACLVSAKDAMVTRKSIIDRVWNGNALVGETGLTNAIYSLRRSLQDTDPDNPLIRTVPRRGYQFTVRARLTDNAEITAFSPRTPIVGKPQWHLSRLLNRNAISEIWLAQEQGGQVQRVFRFCRSERYLRLLRRETTVMRYLREALAGRKDIATVLDWQLEEPPYFLEMDHASHGSLVEWSASRGGLDRVLPAERMRLIGEIAAALAAVHAVTVVHRNVCAASIQIDNDSGDDRVRARLGEFGLSEVTERSRLVPLNITVAGLSLTGDEGNGEEMYLAPELRTGLPATPASDVYALGVLLVQLVLGDLQRAVYAGWQRDVDSNRLRELIAACTDAQAERRPTAAAVSEQLRAFNATTDASKPDERSMEASPPPAAPTAPVSLVGQTIGPYRILDPLGEGGMGLVYLAEQNEPVQRKVALKLIKTGMDSRQVLARFEAERQALALMNHVNVATVYDAGSTPLGQPYFAMELVRGLEITAHCDQLEMDLRERIILFLQACDGVLHAHQKGLIHRDLKPSNILVNRAQDQAGTVKIIDFGVAKSLLSGINAPAAHTRLGSFVGTPTYSSPEQISGPLVNVDTRADIYSLGVVLYQLLAGVTPYNEDELNRKTPVELARLLSADSPPSLLMRFSGLSVEDESEIAKHRSLTIERLKAMLGTDVSWIVGKCLQSDPDDRYPSVLELQKDLRRWLEDKPIEARPTSRLYRAHKFIRRHRAGVALASAMMLALLLTTGAAIYGLQRARKANVEAEMVADFQIKQMQSIDPAAMGLGLRSRLIETVQKRGAERGWELTAVAQGQQQLNTLIEGVNFTDLSLEQLDTHSFQPTLASIKKDFKDHPLLQTRLWQSMADTLVKLGQLEVAVEPQRLALEQRRRLLGADDLLTLVSLRSQGALLVEMGQYKKAETDLRAAMTGMRRTLGSDHPETLRSISEVSSVLFEAGKYEDGLVYAQEALAGYRRVLGENHPGTLEALTLTGALLWRQQKFAEAEALLREALEGHRRVYGKQHPETMVAMNDLAALLMDTGQFDEAETMLLQVVAYQRIHFGSEHPDTLTSYGNLSAVLSFEGRFAESETIKRQLLEVMRRSLGEDHPATLNRSSSLASVLKAEGKIDESIALYRQLLAISLRKDGSEDRRTVAMMTYLASVLEVKGEFEEANALMKNALQVQRRNLGDTNRNTLGTIVRMASLSKTQGDLKRAETLLREALAGFRKTLGDDNRDTLATIDKLGQVLRERGQLDEAMALGQESIKSASDARYPRQSPITLFEIHYARTLLDLRRYEDAERLFDKAKTALSQDKYPDKKSAEELILGYIALYSQRQTVEPDRSFDTKAQLWRNKLDALKKDATRPAAALLSDKQVLSEKQASR